MSGEGVPEGLLATLLELDVMLPCVGQGAVGLEIRAGDARAEMVCARLNHRETFQAVAAERAFLAALGGGCQSPVAAYGRLSGGDLLLQGVSYRDALVRRGQVWGGPATAAELGRELAARLSPGPTI